MNSVKLAGYNINNQKSVAFLDTTNELAECSVYKQTPFNKKKKKTCPLGNTINTESIFYAKGS